MPNHTPVRAGGWPNGAPLTSTEASQLQDRVLKSPNGDDGSTHSGMMEFGGLKAQHLAEKRTTTTTTSGAGPHAVTVDFNVESMRIVKVSSQATDQTLTITISNVQDGDMGSVWVKKVDGPNRRLTVAFAGTRVKCTLGDSVVDNDAPADAVTRFEVRGYLDPDEGGVVAHVFNRGTYRSS